MRKSEMRARAEQKALRTGPVRPHSMADRARNATLCARRAARAERR